MGILHLVAELHMIYLDILGHSRERKNPVLANKYGKVYGYIYIFSAVSTNEKNHFYISIHFPGQIAFQKWEINVFFHN